MEIFLNTLFVSAQELVQYHVNQQPKATTFFQSGIITHKGYKINILFQHYPSVEQLKTDICDFELFIFRNYQLQLKNADIILYDSFKNLTGNNFLRGQILPRQQVPIIINAKILCYVKPVPQAVTADVLKGLLLHSIKNKDAQIRAALSSFIVNQYLQLPAPDCMEQGAPLPQYSPLCVFQFMQHKLPPEQFRVLIQQLGKTTQTNSNNIDSLFRTYIEPQTAYPDMFFKHATGGSYVRISRWGSTSVRIDTFKVKKAAVPVFSSAYYADNCITDAAGRLTGFINEAKQESQVLYTDSLQATQQDTTFLKSLHFKALLHSKRKQRNRMQQSPAAEKTGTPFPNYWSLRHTKVNFSNTYSFNKYQPVASHLGNYQFGEVNTYISKELKDYWENNNIQLQYSIPRFFQGSDVVLSWGKYHKKADFYASYIRSSRNIKRSNFADWNIDNKEVGSYPLKVVSHIFNAVIDLPLSYYLNATWSTAFRSDKTLVQSLDHYSSAFNPVYNHLLHNTLSINRNAVVLNKHRLPLYGMKGSISLDNFYKVTSPSRSTNSISFSLEYYEQLREKHFFSIKQNVNVSFGKQKILYNMFGTTDQVISDIDQSMNNIQDDAVYLVQTVAPVIRGLRQNQLQAPYFGAINADYDYSMTIAIDAQKKSVILLQVGAYADFANTFRSIWNSYFIAGAKAGIILNNIRLSVYVPANDLRNWNISIKF